MRHMSFIPESFIDDVLARTDLVELIHARVPLKKKGKEYAACCPFHQEKTPSSTLIRINSFITALVAGRMVMR